MPFFHAALALAATALVPAQAAPPPPAQQVAPRIIAGFRSARFRMTAREVRRAIAADFPGAAIVERSNAGEGTTSLQVGVDFLDPGPGAATVSYVFGATSHTLAQVSVVWATSAAATADERQAIAVAGLRLSRYFRDEDKAATIVPPKVVSPGTLSLYGALDADGAAIELVASGIAYSDASAAAAPPVGPAVLRLSYMVNPANPDIRPSSPTPR